MSSDDPWGHPDTQRWLEHCTKELVPMVQRSKMTISLIPEEADYDDIKFAVELGLSIMLDKPLIVVVPPGRQVPAGLIKVADEIVEWDGTGNPAKNKGLRDAMDRVLRDEA